MFKHLSTLLLLINLAGCNSVNPVWDTFKAATGWGEGKNAPLTPGVEYLKVNVDGRQAMMALGYRTFPNPSANTASNNSSSSGNLSNLSNPTNGEQLVRNAKLYSTDPFIHEYWYSGQKEMIELVEGRIVSVMGMTTEWRQTNSKAPSWDSLSSYSMPTAWVRNRDLMPGYRYGFKDEVMTKIVEAPPKNKEFPIGAVWFQDNINSKGMDGSEWAYQQLFAWVNGKTLYSEQCIAQDLCLTLKYIGVISKQ